MGKRRVAKGSDAALWERPRGMRGRFHVYTAWCLSFEAVCDLGLEGGEGRREGGAGIPTLTVTTVPTAWCPYLGSMVETLGGNRGS
jgi:hypothetical protein